MKKIITAILGSVVLFGATNTTMPTDPFEQMDKIFQMQMKQMEMMQKQMDAMFKAFEAQSQSAFKMPVIVSSSGGMMSSGLVDKGDHYEVIVQKSDNANAKVNVEAKNGMLTIKVEEQKSIDKNSSNGIIKSFSSSSYMQSFTLPKDADEKSINYDTKGNKIIIKIAKKKK